MLHISEVVLYDKIQIKKHLITEKELLNTFSYPLEDSLVSTVQSDDEFWYLGIGCLNRLKVDNIVDNRITKKLDVPLQFMSTLFPAQQRTLDKFKVDDSYVSGIVKAKCGWGKLYWGVKLTVASQEPTLILVHTKLLMEQWIKEFKLQTGYEPGVIGDGIFNPKDITIGLYISVNSRIEQIKNNFTRVIVDEVHRCGADLFANTLNRLPAKYKNGMSATPNRRDGKHVLFPDYFSDLFIEAEEYRNLLIPTIDIQQVPYKFDVINPTTDWAKALNKIYANENYIKDIADKTNNLISEGRKCLLLGIRTEALVKLQTLIPNSRILDGSVKKKEDREEILNLVDSSVDCILSTTIFDEGLSCHRLDTLILTEPIGKNFAKLEQRIGRIQREHPEKQPILVVPYWLQNHILSRQQSVEYRWYQYNKFNVLS